MENRKNSLILIVLALALFVQVFNAASLYASFSNLSDIMRFAGSAFIGISAEIGIFTCVYAGSSRAGKYFAVLSFFVGILFHANFTDFNYIDFWTSKNFIASTLMQIINSSLVWFLSELYVERTETDRTKTDYKKIKQEFDTLKKTLPMLSKEVKGFEHDIEIGQQMKAQLEQDIRKLQKQKAGMSRIIE